MKLSAQRIDQVTEKVNMRTVIKGDGQYVLGKNPRIYVDDILCFTPNLEDKDVSFHNVNFSPLQEYIADSKKTAERALLLERLCGELLRALEVRVTDKDPIALFQNGELRDGHSSLIAQARELGIGE